MKNGFVFFAAFSLAILSVHMSTANAKFYDGKACRSDYKRLCGTTPRGQCDLATMMDKLSPACKALVQKG